MAVDQIADRHAGFQQSHVLVDMVAGLVHGGDHRVGRAAVADPSGAADSLFCTILGPHSRNHGLVRRPEARSSVSGMQFGVITDDGDKNGAPERRSATRKLKATRRGEFGIPTSPHGRWRAAGRRGTGCGVGRKAWLVATRPVGFGLLKCRTAW